MNIRTLNSIIRTLNSSIRTLNSIFRTLNTSIRTLNSTIRTLNEYEYPIPSTPRRRVCILRPWTPPRHGMHRRRCDGGDSTAGCNGLRHCGTAQRHYSACSERGGSAQPQQHSPQRALTAARHSSGSRAAAAHHSLGSDGEQRCLKPGFPRAGRRARCGRDQPVQPSGIPPRRCLKPSVHYSQ